MENLYYSAAADEISGGLVSLFDKETGLELVDPRAGYTLNQYVYETPEGGRKAVDDMEKRAKFDRASPVAATVAPGLSGPVATSIVVSSQAKGCPEIKQEFILYERLKRLDIVNRLKKTATYDPEALYFAFPLRIEGASLRFEIADGTMAPETEQLPGTTRDWHTVQHWVEAAGPRGSAVWSPIEAPLVEFGDINTGKWLRKLELARPSIFSYAMNNYWMTNFKAGQGGAFVFRYALTSRAGGADPVKSSRFGWEVHAPLQAAWLPARNKGSLSPQGMSFLTIDAPNVIVQAVKPAEDGAGIVLRLREIGGAAAEARIACPLWKSDVVTYSVTTIDEAPANARTVVPGSVVVPLKPFEIATVRLRPGR